jgi:hypothetical protein
MCEQDQLKFDNTCPPDFQSSTYVANYGQLDMILEDNADGTSAGQSEVESVVARVAALLGGGNGRSTSVVQESSYEAPTESDLNAPFNYTRSRKISRPQVTLPLSHSSFDVSRYKYLNLHISLPSPASISIH